MKKSITKQDYLHVKEIIKSNKIIKTVIYVTIAIATLFVLSKIFVVLASTVRSFNQLKLAMSGQ